MSDVNEGPAPASGIASPSGGFLTRRGPVRAFTSFLMETVALLFVGTVLGVGINALSRDPAELRQPVFPASASGTTSCSATGHSVPKMMSVEEAVTACDGCTAGFVDARGAAAYADGHLPGAVHLPPAGHPDERATLEPLRRFTTIVVYDDGRVGDRSAACPLAEGVAERLELAYFPDVRVLEGGWAAWHQVGGPAESGACSECASPAASSAVPSSGNSSGGNSSSSDASSADSSASSSSVEPVGTTAGGR